MTSSSTERSAAWKWTVCFVLFLATTLNYMDRQTLAQTTLVIKPELHLDEGQCGLLEKNFGYAFAFGGLFFGYLADRLRIYYLYPLLILCWSITGFATAYAVDIGIWLGGETLSEQAYLGFRLCRTALGFFEAAQWPFALVTTSRLLSRGERSLGNGILQSGTAIGSIITPIVVQLLVTDEPGTWRLPYLVIGVIGTAWIPIWLLIMKPSDLSRPGEVATTATGASASLPADVFTRRLIVCAFMVVAINAPWHFFRFWLPQFLDTTHAYSRSAINWFSVGYYVAADAGCLGIGFLARWLVVRGWDVHASRASLIGLCAAGVALGGVAAVLPSGPVLIGALLVVGAAGLGIFPNYYSYSQDLSGRHQGMISGILGFTTWMVSGTMHGLVGNHIRDTKSYTEPMIAISLAPLVAFVVLLLVWKQWPPKQERAV